MAVLSSEVLTLFEAAGRRRSAATVGETFFAALQPFGARAIYARIYRPSIRPADGEVVLSRISPPGWESLYAERDFQKANYLAREVKKHVRPFRWSQAQLLTKEERRLAQALKDNGFPDGLAIPYHGVDGAIGVLSLAFENLDEISPSDRLAIEVASSFAYQRMLDLDGPRVANDSPPLSPRERECLAFVAEGWSDASIAQRLSLQEVTVLTHVQNAKRKLKVRTRAQAVAACILRGLF